MSDQNITILNNKSNELLPLTHAESKALLLVHTNIALKISHYRRKIKKKGNGGRREKRTQQFTLCGIYILICLYIQILNYISKYI
jgi:hypothetical protein